MSALKHMELIFGVVVVAGCIAAALPAGGAAQAQAQAQPAAARFQAVQPGIPVVVVKGKRLSTLEERASPGAAPAVRRDGATGT
jgi:hypothetical protein